MALGDVKQDLQPVAAGSALVIRPSVAGEEWVVHNIYHEYDVDIVLTDGTNELIFESLTGSGALAKYAFHVTYNQFLKVVNKDTATARLIGYDGVITKEVAV